MHEEYDLVSLDESHILFTACMEGKGYKDRSVTNVNSLFLKLNIPIGLNIEKKDQIRELKTEKKAESLSSLKLTDHQMEL